MKLIFSLSLMLLCISEVFGQNYVFKGAQKYPSTSSWDFMINEYRMPDKVNVCIAKTKTGGFLMLSSETNFDEETISGNVFMILKNGKTVTLTQKAATDRVNGKCQVLYVISASAFKLLQESDVYSIRFTITFKAAGTRNNYVAVNRGYGSDVSSTPKYNTAQEITDIQEENQ
jgi:hypothetical protein